MKKLFLMMLTLTVLCLPLSSFAEAAATQLPLGATFGMTLEETLQAMGEGAEVESWSYEADVDEGTVFLEDVPIGIGDIHASFINMNVSTGNSDRKPQMDSIDITVAFEGNCIAAFRSTLADLTAVYGAPDSDPFDEFARESYQEYGNLSASWTTPDTRIYLSLNQAYTENGIIDLNFSYRLCYDLSDLDE